MNTTQVTTSDGVRLHVETHGDALDAGPAPLLFIHEFAGSCRSFDGQFAAFGARRACIAFNARGYPPSSVPESPADYGEPRAMQDIAEVVDALQCSRVHVVGVSMGAASALQFALAHPRRVASLTLVGIGTGSDGDPAASRAASEAIAALIEQQGLDTLAEKMGAGPTRHRLRDKHPDEFERFMAQFKAMSPQGAALTMRGVQMRRPPLYAHAARIAALGVPVLVLVGGDDLGCMAPSRFLNDTLPDVQLVVQPDTGHAVNLEEPTEFNRLLAAFIDDAERRQPPASVLAG